MNVYLYYLLVDLRDCRLKKGKRIFSIKMILGLRVGSYIAHIKMSLHGFKESYIPLGVHSAFPLKLCKITNRFVDCS